MDPFVWGKHAWFFLHTITFTYPKKPTELDKRHMYDFFMKLQYILPCDMCKKHYKEHLYNMPLAPHLESRNSLVLWFIRFHNTVNKSLGKKQLSAEEVMNIYNNHYKKKGEKSSTSLIIRWVIISILVSITGFYCYKYIKKHYSKKSPFILQSQKGGAYRTFKTYRAHIPQINKTIFPKLW